MSATTGDFERQLKIAVRTGKYVVGRKEVQGSLKGSKLLVWSASANLPHGILDECKNFQIPAIRFDGNPIELGKTCGIPYKVSVIAVKSPGDAILTSFENSREYESETLGELNQGLVSEPIVKSQPSEIKSEEQIDHPKKKKQITGKKEGQENKKSKAKTEEDQAGSPKKKSKTKAQEPGDKVRSKKSSKKGSDLSVELKESSRTEDTDEEEED